MTHVFLSYSAKDMPFAEKLRAELATRHIDTWNPETDLAPGESLQQAILNAIQQSDAVIAILSPESIKNPWVNSEVALALSDRLKGSTRPLIPVLAQHVDESPPFLRDIRWTDMSTEDRFKKSIEQVVEAVRSAPSQTATKDAESAKREMLESEKRLLELEFKAFAESQLRNDRMITTGMIGAIGICLSLVSLILTFLSPDPDIEWSILSTISFCMAGAAIALIFYYILRVQHSQPHSSLRDSEEVKNARH